MDEQYLFVIDTDKYAGNFEREMCAYITGQIGDCGVGTEEAEIAQEEIPEIVSELEEIIAQVPDEHGCSRPVSIFPNPRYGNAGNGEQEVVTEKNQKNFPYPAYNSIAIYFNEMPNRELIDSMKRRAEVFSSRKVNYKNGRDIIIDEKIKIEGFRFLEKTTTYTELPC